MSPTSTKRSAQPPAVTGNHQSNLCPFAACRPPASTGVGKARDVVQRVSYGQAVTKASDIDAADQAGPVGLDGAPPQPPYTAQGFLTTAQMFARSAAEHYSPSDAPFFFLHAGAAVEHLIKAALCATSPALLLESRSGNDYDLIRLLGYAAPRVSGQGAAHRAKDRAPYTVSLSKAIDRYLFLRGQGSLGASADQLAAVKAARDLTAHGGVGSRQSSEAMHEVLVAVAAVVEALTEALALNPTEFWGNHHGLVERVKDNRDDELATRARTLITAARNRFSKKYEGVDPAALESLRAESFWRSDPKNDEWSRPCPACNAQGTSRVKPELRRSISVDGKTRLSAGYRAVNFRCLVCSLQLDSEGLIAVVSDFEAWEEEPDALDYWVDDYGSENLTEEEQRALGLEW